MKRIRMKKTVRGGVDKVICPKCGKRDHLKVMGYDYSTEDGVLLFDISCEKCSGVRIKHITPMKNLGMSELGKEAGDA